MMVCAAASFAAGDSSREWRGNGDTADAAAPTGAACMLVPLPYVVITDASPAPPGPPAAFS